MSFLNIYWTRGTGQFKDVDILLCFVQNHYVRLQVCDTDVRRNCASSWSLKPRDVRKDGEFVSINIWDNIVYDVIVSPEIFAVIKAGFATIQYVISGDLNNPAVKTENTSASAADDASIAEGSMGVLNSKDSD